MAFLVHSTEAEVVSGPQWITCIPLQIFLNLKITPQRAQYLLNASLDKPQLSAF